MYDTWPPEPTGTSAWSETGRRRLATILCAILPPEELGGDSEKVPAFVGAFVAMLPPLRRAGFRVLTELFYWGVPVWTIGRFSSLGRLPQTDREAAIGRIFASDFYPFRLAAVGFKSLAGLGILGDPDVRRSIGIDPVRDPAPPLDPNVRWNEDIEGLGRPGAASPTAPTGTAASTEGDR